MTYSTFRFRVRVAREARFGTTVFAREDFFAWVWEKLGDQGLQGVHEGTMLADQAHAHGLETESFTIDAALAPRERDWVSGQDNEEAELYFGSVAEAESGRVLLTRGWEGVEVLSAAEEVPAQDWDREWKLSFPGVRLAPFWHVLPPWKDAREELHPGERLLRLNPGAGFGTGTHETTQLCLSRLGELALLRGATHDDISLNGMRVLDFGSGSGILSIGAALLGASVDACEIDPLANDNAAGNADLNGVTPKIRIVEELATLSGPYDLLIANILKPVLLEFRDRLFAVRKPGAAVLLSGLVEADVEEVSRAYAAKLNGRMPVVAAAGDWRSLWWSSEVAADAQA